MNKNKLPIILAMALLSVGISASASDKSLAMQTSSIIEESACGLEFSTIEINRQDETMNVFLSMNLGEYDLKGDRAAIFIPVITNGADSLKLDPVGLYSNIRYIQYIRNNNRPIGGEGEATFKYKKRPIVFDYSQSVPYQTWMNGAQLEIIRRDYGCCNSILEECISPLGIWQEIVYQPKLVFQESVAATIKTREISGRAYVDFPVNKIVIYPEYRNNTYELGKIIATIDSVKNDPDITVTSIHIAGTASPEGPYDNNVYLAKNRTIALKDYVTNLYNFPKDFIQTDYEPVDWKGLREWLENNNISHKEEILAIVNSDIEPYARNSKIKKDFPTEYDWLLRNVYPALRHSDYKIEYTIRQFIDVAEIAEVIRTSPQKLSLNEMYLLAQSLQPGSDEYNDVFEIAVRMYPSDETANLNAANVAMQKGDMVAAEKYLEKAGDSATAIYARGVLAAQNQDYDTAFRLFRQVASEIKEAAEAVAILEQIAR